MIADWTQPIVMLASIFAVFLWLRNDMKSHRDETRSDMRQLRTDMQNDMQQLRSDLQNDMQQLRAGMQSDMQQLRADILSDIQRLETKVDGLDSPLRAVETEQSRVAGLLEGLGLAGALPTRDD